MLPQFSTQKMAIPDTAEAARHIVFSQLVFFPEKPFPGGIWEVCTVISGVQKWLWMNHPVCRIHDISPHNYAAVWRQQTYGRCKKDKIGLPLRGCLDIPNRCCTNGLTFTVNLMYTRAENSCAFASRLESTYTQVRSHSYPCLGDIQHGVTAIWKNAMVLPFWKWHCQSQITFVSDFEVFSCCKEGKKEETAISGDCTWLIPWLVSECWSGVDMVNDRDLFQRLVSIASLKQ